MTQGKCDSEEKRIELPLRDVSRARTPATPDLPSWTAISKIYSSDSDTDFHDELDRASSPDRQQTGTSHPWKLDKLEADLFNYERVAVPARDQRKQPEPFLPSVPDQSAPPAATGREAQGRVERFTLTSAPSGHSVHPFGAQIKPSSVWDSPEESIRTFDGQAPPLAFAPVASQKSQQKEVFDAVEIEIRTHHGKYNSNLRSKYVLGQNDETAYATHGHHGDSSRAKSPFKCSSSSMVIGDSEPTSSVFTAMLNTVCQNLHVSSSLSFPISHERTSPPRGPRQPLTRKVSCTPSLSSITSPALKPYQRKGYKYEDVFLAESDVDALLDTHIAPISINVRTYAGAEQLEVGPDFDFDAGWAIVAFENEDESVEERAKRIRTNARFLRSKAAVDIDTIDVDINATANLRCLSDATIKTEALAATTRRVTDSELLEGSGRYTDRRETPEVMLINRQAEMFGAGSVDRGGGAKPKSKSKSKSKVKVSDIFSFWLPKVGGWCNV